MSRRNNNYDNLKPAGKDFDKCAFDVFQFVPQTGKEPAFAEHVMKCSNRYPGGAARKAASKGCKHIIVKNVKNGKTYAYDGKLIKLKKNEMTDWHLDHGIKNKGKAIRADINQILSDPAYKQMLLNAIITHKKVEAAKRQEYAAVKKLAKAAFGGYPQAL